MKKIININLSGRVIPIEDSAYEKLQAYIESLRRYFAKEESRDEIINDIESRIAELMSERVRKGADSITDADVDDIATSMGRPEDFDAEETMDAGTAGAKTSASSSSSSSSQQNQQQQQFSGGYSEKTKTSRGRLYRDTSDKFIGGVCSGIAAYLNVDPAIVRILFAIVTFGGFGIGFLAYILMWMILPAKDIEPYGGKRLFRNPDDKVIGGVAGGLAAYFDRSVTTIRLIFAAPFILSILFSMLRGFSYGYDFDFFPNIVSGSLSGTFFLAYVILWMVLPEARSPYEKMEMRGEKVDVNSIRQNVKEGVDNMKDRMKGWSEEVKASAQSFSEKAKEFGNTRGKEFTREFNETARRTGGGIGHAIGVVFKAFFLFIFGTIAFALFVALIGFIFGGVAWWPVNNFLWTSKWQQIYAWGTLIFFFAVPLIGFITWVIRRIIRVRSRSSYLGWTFGFLWTVGWVSAILLVASITKDFRQESEIPEVAEITQPVNGRMIVAVSQPELKYNGNFSWVNDEGMGWSLSEDTMKLSFVKIRVSKSEDAQYHVLVVRKSNGRTEQEAKARAEKINYKVFSKDSILDLASGYAIDKNSKFRWQHVEIEIQVPVGKRINFDESVTDKLNMVSFRINRKYKRNGITITDYEDHDSFYFDTNKDYIMDADGNLKDMNGKKVNDVNYRYDSKTSDSLQLEEQLREEKRLREEADKRIKDLEEKQKQNKPVTHKMETMDDDTDGTATGSSSPSPVLSLLNWF